MLLAPPCFQPVLRPVCSPALWPGFAVENELKNA